MTDKAMSIIYSACTENWNDEELHLVLSDTVSRVKILQHISKIRVEKGLNPSVLFKSLTTIQNQYFEPSVRLSKDEIIAIVLYVASEEYRQIQSLE
jgi:hypothetical protein